MNIEAALRAVASRRRIQILDWLKAPTDHFPPQVDGDLIKDGVCGLLIARKLRVSQPTASAHLNTLVHAGLVKGKRMGKWTFYRRNKAGIQAMKRIITRTI